MLSSIDGILFEPFVGFGDLEYILVDMPEESRIPKQITDKCPIIFRALQSSEKAVQSEFFITAFRLIKEHYPDISSRFEIETLLNKDIRKRSWSPEDVVNWSLAGHIHLLYTHVHQGLIDPGIEAWNVNVIEGQLLRLYNHLGFPYGKYLACTIFLQNKCAYGFGIADHILPTLIIPFNIDIDDALIVAYINQFCVDNVEDVNGKWIVKIPYTTNQKYKSRSNLKDVIDEFKRLRNKWNGVLPYVFIQAYLKNRMEYNVVCLNGVALYEASINKSAHVTSKFSEPRARRDFAETVIKTLTSKRPESLVSGLIRVDIMWCEYLNKMIVIELESLEAGHWANATETRIENQLHNYLGHYHANNIILCIRKLLNCNISLLPYPLVDISTNFQEDNVIFHK